MINDVEEYRLYVYDFREKTVLRACKSIDACVNYTGDSNKLCKIVQGIAAVYRAEREGNGEYSEEEVLQNVKVAVRRLKDVLEE